MLRFASCLIAAACVTSCGKSADTTVAEQPTTKPASEPTVKPAAAPPAQQPPPAATQASSTLPADLPFRSWGVASVAPAYAAGTQVWAVAARRDGVWRLGQYRYKASEPGALVLEGGGEAWAPSGFVHAAAPASGMRPGDPALLSIGALMPYGRVTKLDVDKVVVQYLSGSRVQESTLDAARVLPMPPRTWTFAAPLAYRAGTDWIDGRLVLDAGEDAYVLTRDGVQKVAKAELRLIDVAKRWTKGARVMAMRIGMTRAFVAGTIEQVHSDVSYTIKTADGSFDQTFDKLIDRL